MQLDIEKTRRRIFPKLSLINYRKEFPTMSKDSFSDWFNFSKTWGGKIWEFQIKHYALNIDFRTCPISDMAFPNASKRDRDAIKKAKKYI